MTYLETLQMPDLLPQISPTLVRSYPAHRYLTGLRYAHASPTRLLDVGGFVNNPVLRMLCPDTQIVSINIPNEYHYPKRYGDVTYDGVHMPFPDHEIPLIMAVDVLQHVPDANRLPLLLEMTRAAQDQVIVSGPFHSAQNVEWENTLLAQMAIAGLSPKTSIKRHRENNSLPDLASLVEMVRQTGYAFNIYPATIAALDFQGLLNQVEIYRQMGVNDSSTKIAKAIAANTESLLEKAPEPIWPQAYRAVLAIDIRPSGRIINDDSELFYSLTENTAYGRALAKAGWGNIADGVGQYKENPLRGFCIGLEGQDGTGKTDIIEILSLIMADYGYSVAKPSRLGPRKNFRAFEKAHGILSDSLIREIFLADTTIQSTVAGNAHALLGPCHLAFVDRTLASVDVFHRIKGLHTKPIEAVLANAPRIPPFMTILLEVDSEEENWERMRRKNDPANMHITREELTEQRKHFGQLEPNQYTGPLYRVKNNGPVEETVQTILNLISDKCGIRLSRDLSIEEIKTYIRQVIPDYLTAF